MSHSHSQKLFISTDSSDFVQKRSSLYEEFMAERAAILEHKWLESEKAGYDIGFERALMDWIRNYRDHWRISRRKKAPLSDRPSLFPDRLQA